MLAEIVPVATDVALTVPVVTVEVVKAEPDDPPKTGPTTVQATAPTPTRISAIDANLSFMHSCLSCLVESLLPVTPRESSPSKLARRQRSSAASFGEAVELVTGTRRGHRRSPLQRPRRSIPGLDGLAPRRFTDGRTRPNAGVGPTLFLEQQRHPRSAVSRLSRRLSSARTQVSFRRRSARWLALDLE